MCDVRLRKDIGVNSAKRLEWQLYTVIELESSTPQISNRATGHNPEPLTYTFHSILFSKCSSILSSFLDVSSDPIAAGFPVIF